MQLWDYVSIVKEPMDLGTVRGKLEETIVIADRNNSAEAPAINATGVASSIKPYELTASGVLNVLGDIRLTFKNCLNYNAEGSEFHLLGIAFMKVSAKR